MTVRGLVPSRQLEQQTQRPVAHPESGAHCAVYSSNRTFYHCGQFISFAACASLFDMLRSIIKDASECAAGRWGCSCTFTSGMKSWVDLGTAEYRPPKPFRVGQYFDITIINSQSIYSHTYVV